MAAVPSTGRASRIEAPRPREADATRDLYERYANQIFGYCLHQLGSREEAEDAVQSTFLNAFRGLTRGIVPEAEAAWLFTIAQNVCLSRRRSSWRRGRIESPADFELVEELTPAPSRRGDELIGLQDVLEQMPENQRRAILLREWQGLSYREIAEELELSQSAVETLIFRARRSLAEGLEKPPEALRARIRRGADLGNVLAGLKSLLLGGSAAAKVAATVAVVSAATVSAAAPVEQHHARHHTTPAPAASTTSAPSQPSSGGTAPTAQAPSHAPAATRGNQRAFRLSGVWGSREHAPLASGPSEATTPPPAASAPVAPAFQPVSTPAVQPPQAQPQQVQPEPAQQRPEPQPRSHSESQRPSQPSQAPPAASQPAAAQPASGSAPATQPSSGGDNGQHGAQSRSDNAGSGSGNGPATPPAQSPPSSSASSGSSSTSPGLAKKQDRTISTGAADSNSQGNGSQVNAGPGASDKAASDKAASDKTSPAQPNGNGNENAAAPPVAPSPPPSDTQTPPVVTVTVPAPIATSDAGTAQVVSTGSDKSNGKAKGHDRSGENG